MAQQEAGKGLSRRNRAEARRLQIIDAALTLFAQHGYAATTTKQIAQAVGVTEGLIFHYFDGKAQLLLAVAQQRMDFLRNVLAMLEQAGSQPAQEVLGEVVLGWMGAIEDQSDLITMLLVESQTNTELRGVFKNVVQQIVGAMAQYLQARVAAGELRHNLDVQTSASLFFSSLMMFFLTHRDVPAAQWRQQATKFTESMLHTWFHGALAASPDPVG